MSKKKRRRGLKADHKGATPEQVVMALFRYRAPIHWQ